MLTINRKSGQTYEYKYKKYKKKYKKLKLTRQITKENKYTISVKQPWFGLIKQGKKTIEGRLNRGLFSKVQVGDIIIWTNKYSQDKIKTKITKLTYYKSFKNMLEKEGLDSVLPGSKSIDKGVSVYMNYFTKEDEEKNGVVAISLQLDKQNIWYLPIQNPPHCPTFDLIKSGKKTVEGRKNSPKYQQYQVGDKLVFIYKDQKLPTVITKINKYKNVKDYLEEETLEIALPCVDTIEDGVTMYNMWTKPEERKELQEKYGFGFLGIHIKLL